MRKAYTVCLVYNVRLPAHHGLTFKSMDPDAALLGAGTNGAGPKPASEPGVFSTLDDAGSASVGRFPGAAARPDQYVAQTVLAPASVPILDLNAETLSERRAERVALRDIVDDGAAPASAAPQSPSACPWQPKLSAYRLSPAGGPPRFIRPYVPGRVLRAPRAELPLMVRHGCKLPPRSPCAAFQAGVRPRWLTSFVLTPGVPAWHRRHGLGGEPPVPVPGGGL